MTYYPKALSGAGMYHDHWSETPHGSNSHNGAPLAVAHGKVRIDNDGTRTKDFVLLNDHGWPLKVYFPHGSSRDFTWEEIRGRHYVWHNQTYHPRTIAQAMADNARHHIKGKPLGTEVEIKNLHPITKAELDALMVQLAKDALAAYGMHWKQYVIVKVVVGTLHERLEVCAAAHVAGLQTLISVSGKERFLSFANHVEVTYVRGSLNHRIRMRH